ncbi:MAG: hypothetical protein IPK19_16745 [Chloroflexi bacterium]|nr:hypothetical protein [Chloroflexota bacterium]
MTESQSGFIIRNVYSRLVDIAHDGNGIEPGPRGKLGSPDDGLVYTFHLRPGVTFHDGSTLTASDVVYSLQRFLSIGEGDSRRIRPSSHRTGRRARRSDGRNHPHPAVFGFPGGDGHPRGASIVPGRHG